MGFKKETSSSSFNGYDSLGKSVSFSFPIILKSLIQYTKLWYNEKENKK